MKTREDYKKEKPVMITGVCAFNHELDSFYQYLSGIVKVYEDLLPVIKEELKAIGEKNISLLDENLKKQQALLFQTRCFDKEIADYTAGLNSKAKNLSSLIGELPQDRQPQFFSLLRHFGKVTDEVSFYKGKCKVLLQAQLYSIDKAIAQHGGTARNKTYQGNATIGTGQCNAFETIV